jgi:hypothetical protein
MINLDHLAKVNEANQATAVFKLGHRDRKQAST